MILKAIVHKAEEGGFWAELPAITGCATQGEPLGGNQRLSFRQCARRRVVRSRHSNRKRRMKSISGKPLCP